MDFIPVHQPPLRIGCRYRKCEASFSRKTDAHRHERQIHQPAKIFCKFAGCRFRGTVRAEVMRKHLKSKHPFDVESTFQMQNNFYRCSLPKAEVAFEPSSPIHKVDSFSSWNAGLLPKPPSHDTTDEAEQNLERNMELSYDDCSGRLNRLSGVQEADLDFPIIPMVGYTAFNQESHSHTSIADGEAPKNMISCLVPGQNEAPVLYEQYFRWQLGPRESKDFRLEGGSTFTDNPALYCGLMPNTGQDL